MWCHLTTKLIPFQVTEVDEAEVLSKKAYLSIYRRKGTPRFSSLVKS